MKKQPIIQSQSDKFKQTARELECDESEEAFNAKLGKLAKVKSDENAVIKS